jgi:hypothetical protein
LKKENNNSKIISIVSLQNTGRQQLQSFSDHNIHLTTWENLGHSINLQQCDDGLVVCLNSLWKIYNVDPDQLKHYVLFIDECQSIAQALIENITIRPLCKQIYTTLMFLLQNCGKVIFSDKNITNAATDLLTSRNPKNTVFIKNNFKKFQDVHAYEYEDEMEFCSKIESEIENNNYFLFASDSCEYIEKLVVILKEKFPEQEQSFLLITKKHDFKLQNASEQFKDKYVFYSPSITTGVDFSISKKQNQFIYVGGNSVGNPMIPR